MKKRAWVLPVLLGIGWGLAGCGGSGQAGEGTVLETFESGWNGWSWRITLPAASPDATISTQQANSPQSSVRLFMDAAPTDDGVLWIEKAVSVPVDSSFQVAVRFWLWSAQKSDVNQWSTVAYIGRNAPAGEGDFAILGNTDQVAGWKEYTYTANISSDLSGRIYVAVGISATSEYARTYYIDDVLVTYFKQKRVHPNLKASGELSNRSAFSQPSKATRPGSLLIAES